MSAQDKLDEMEFWSREYDRRAWLERLMNSGRNPTDPPLAGMGPPFPAPRGYDLPDRLREAFPKTEEFSTISNYEDEARLVIALVHFGRVTTIPNLIELLTIMLSVKGAAYVRDFLEDFGVGLEFEIDEYHRKEKIIKEYYEKGGQ